MDVSKEMFKRASLWTTQESVGPNFVQFFFLTVTAQRYRNNILTAFVQELQDDELQDGVFQHDGATTHTTVDNLNFLRELFDDRVISLDSVPECPKVTRFNPSGLLLFGYLKNTVFKSLIHTIEELKDRITEKCARITTATLQTVNLFTNLQKLRSFTTFSSFQQARAEFRL